MVREYIDYDSAYGEGTRTGFDQMMQDLNTMDWEFIGCVRADRFFRDVEHGIHYARAIAKANKTLYLIENDLTINTDTLTTSKVNMLCTVHLMVGQEESLVRSNRAKDAYARLMNEARQQGTNYVWGRKKDRILIGVREADGTIINKRGTELLNYVKQKRREAHTTESMKPYEFEYLYGYINNKKVLALRSQGLSMRSIAKRFGISTAPIQRIINSSNLKG